MAFCIFCSLAFSTATSYIPTFMSLLSSHCTVKPCYYIIIIIKSRSRARSREEHPSCHFQRNALPNFTEVRVRIRAFLSWPRIHGARIRVQCTIYYSAQMVQVTPTALGSYPDDEIKRAGARGKLSVLWTPLVIHVDDPLIPKSLIDQLALVWLISVVVCQGYEHDNGISVCSIAFFGLKFEAFTASAVPHEPILTVIETPLEKGAFCIFVLCALHFTSIHCTWIQCLGNILYTLNNYSHNIIRS